MATNDSTLLPYAFRVNKTFGNIRVRECEHCEKRTKQRQAQDDANGKWVEHYRCQTCLTETK
jgi:hypothetical protein